MCKKIAYLVPVSQSLAGRTGLVKLLPLSLQELKKVDKAETNDWAELIYISTEIKLAKTFQKQ